MNNILSKIKKKSVIISLLSTVVLLVTIGFLFNSYSLPEPVSSISFTSNKLNYETNEPGSWKVEKSAKWISPGKARITLDVDTVLKINNPQVDVIFALDISSSMYGQKLERVKEDSIELLNTLMDISNNRAALITFETSSLIVSDFTSDKNALINHIKSLKTKDYTNYYSALLSVDKVLENYQKTEDRECIVLFLTDGFPSRGNPNQIAQYQYLKEKYPYLIINGIQYEMGQEILDPIKKISDNQFLANVENLSNVLFDASIIRPVYDKFILTDYINDNYFSISSIDSVHSTIGDVKLEYDGNTPKIIWTIRDLPTGTSPKLTIDVDLKDEFQNETGLFPTNKRENVDYKLGGLEENIESEESPVLSSHYQVIYEANAPDGCTVSNTPNIEQKRPTEVVSFSDTVLKCDGYQFKGWKILTENVKSVGRDYFIMPAEDIILRAEWGKISIAKTMDGEVYNYLPSIIQSAGTGYTGKLWGNKANITKIIFQNVISTENIPTPTYTYDISDANNGSVIAHLVRNTDNTSTYTAYIQGNGAVIANSNSYGLFSGFTKLVSVEGIEYFDTSIATNLGYLFSNCSSLASLNVSSFDTSNVINMDCMFSGCSSLVSLNFGSVDTSNVTSMHRMFYYCSSLISLDISSFDTSKVTSMQDIFYNCSKLETLDVSQFNTENVTDMSNMFNGCSNLNSLDLINFTFTNLTSMTYMFQNCTKLSTMINFYETKLGNSSSTAYMNMFRGAATESETKIIVNYSSTTSSLVDKMIATKSSTSNVIKGEKVLENMITFIGNNNISCMNEYSSVISQGYTGQKISLYLLEGGYEVVSFKLNDVLMEGNQFVMPEEEVSITDVVMKEATVFESEHDPYTNTSNKQVVYGEQTFKDATSITVLLTYQTKSANTDWVLLLDSTGNTSTYGSFGGTTKTTKIIKIKGDYIKVILKTSAEANYYGFKATIIPNY